MKHFTSEEERWNTSVAFSPRYCTTPKEFSEVLFPPPFFYLHLYIVSDIEQKTGHLMCSSLSCLILQVPPFCYWFIYFSSIFGFSVCQQSLDAMYGSTVILVLRHCLKWCSECDLFCMYRPRSETQPAVCLSILYPLCTFLTYKIKSFAVV